MLDVKGVGSLAFGLGFGRGIVGLDVWTGCR